MPGGMAGTTVGAAAGGRGARGFAGRDGGAVTPVGSFAGSGRAAFRRTGAFGRAADTFAADAGSSGIAGDSVLGEAGRRGKRTVSPYVNVLL